MFSQDESTEAMRGAVSAGVACYVVNGLEGERILPLLQLAALHPSRYTHGNAIFAVFAGYVLAKGFEHFDREIFELTGAVSGHTLKHVAAGLAGRLRSMVPFPGRSFG